MVERRKPRHALFVNLVERLILVVLLWVVSSSGETRGSWVGESSCPDESKSILGAYFSPRVVIADYDLLRESFPEQLGVLSEVEINNWIVELCLSHRSLHKDAPTTQTNFFQVTNMRTDETTGASFDGIGVLKGDKSIPLTAAVYSFVTQRIVDKILTAEASPYRMIRGYAVIDWRDSEGSGAVLFQHSHKASNCSPFDIELIESATRKYGVTSALYFKGTSIEDYVIMLDCDSEHKLIHFSPWLVRQKDLARTVLYDQVVRYGPRCNDHYLPPMFAPEGENQLPCYSLSNWKYHDPTSIVNLPQESMLWNTIEQNHHQEANFWWEIVNSIEDHWVHCRNNFSRASRIETVPKKPIPQQQLWYINEEWYKAAQGSIDESWYENIPRRDRYDVAVCCCIAAEPVSLLREFVIRSLIAGIQHIEFLDDSPYSLFQHTNAGLKELIEGGLVTHTHVDHRFNRKYLCTTWNKSEWIAFFDADEFVTLEDYSISLYDFLSQDMFQEAGGVSLYWRHFFSNCHNNYHDRTHTITAQYPYYCVDFIRNVVSKFIARTKYLKEIDHFGPHFAHYYDNKKTFNTRGEVAAVSTIHQHFNLLRRGVFDKDRVAFEGASLSHYWSRSFRDMFSKVSRWKGNRTMSMFLFNELNCKEIQVDESVRPVVGITELLYSKLPQYPDYEPPFEIKTNDSRNLVLKALLEQFRSVLKHSHD
eukprot:TRINITY_DN2061_c0_g1_i3.p1 TRINITY_DN2061_c0_g1~~TRINITY_DN2061_c0_g1_i3.p1  ORF type:complete len:704 (-),score=96.83 TRINITY_DN2061_c0_g1_i3:427-2538(-)